MTRSNHMCSRVGIPQSEIVATLATLTPTVTQIQASRDSRGLWSVFWIGESIEVPVRATTRPNPPSDGPGRAA